jgi:hypothetical protein
MNFITKLWHQRIRHEEWNSTVYWL